MDSSPSMTSCPPKYKMMRIRALAKTVVMSNMIP